MSTSTSQINGTAQPQEQLRRVLSKLDNPVERNGIYRACCPAHDDDKPSLELRIKNNKFVMLCRRGCSSESVLQTLDLTWADVFRDDSHAHTGNGRRTKAKLGRVIATYPYTDEGGNVLLEVLRYEPKDFRQRRPNGKGGWIWSLGHVRRVPYRLPELLASPPDEAIYIVEGEKDVENLALLGIIATTNPQGAGKFGHLDPETIRTVFTGRRVVVLPDADQAGEEHAVDVAQRLHGIAAELRIIRLPGLPPKGDVSDWIERGGTPEQLFELCKQTPAWAPGPSPAPTPTTGEPNRDDNFHLTDLGNAKRVVARHGKDFRYCHPFKKPYVYESVRWREDDTGAAERIVKETQANLYREVAHQIAQVGNIADDEERQRRLAVLTKMLKHCLTWEDAKRLKASLSLATTEPGVPILPDDMDRDAWLFNGLNGTIDLRTGRLREHRREDLITKVAPVQFDINARCPLWLRFLDRIMNGNRGLITYLQRAVGYSLTADVGEQILFFLHGGGANGKSTFLGTIKAMLGSYGHQAVSDLLIAKHNDLRFARILAGFAKGRAA